uniref:Lsm14-like N-terminal domain-containing protein n=1 Tax=Ditylenchus dipsaci TaxID=166011 RepID=A0A915E9P0_9BILA
MNKIVRIGQIGSQPYHSKASLNTVSTSSSWSDCCSESVDEEAVCVFLRGVTRTCRNGKKSGIYGILNWVNIRESTIALSQVRSFGTERRLNERSISALGHIYDFVIFRTDNIKNLVVVETAEPSVNPIIRIRRDPAVVYFTGSVTDAGGVPNARLQESSNVRRDRPVPNSFNFPIENFIRWAARAKSRQHQAKAQITPLAASSHSSNSHDNTPLRTYGPRPTLSKDSLLRFRCRQIIDQDLERALTTPEMPRPVYLSVRYYRDAYADPIRPDQVTEATERDWFAFVTYGSNRMARTARNFFNRQRIVWGSHTSFAVHETRVAGRPMTADEENRYYEEHPECHRDFPARQF